MVGLLFVVGGARCQSRRRIILRHGRRGVAKARCDKLARLQGRDDDSVMDSGERVVFSWRVRFLIILRL